MEVFKGYLLLSTSLTAMPFTTYNYRERAHRERERERGWHAFSTNPSKLNLYLVENKTHRQVLSALFSPDIRLYNFEKQNGDKRKTCEMSTQQRR